MWADLLAEGSMGLALGSALMLIGGMVVERFMLTRFRWTPYFTAGFPLFPELVPIPRAPQGTGETATVRWEVVSDGELIRFWADPDKRTAPSGLHGAIRLYGAGSAHIGLAVRWSPPWTLLIAAGWLVVVGIIRDEPQVTVPIAVVWVIGVMVIYRQGAMRAAAELRWAFVKES
jgi:hypothetical protein